MPDFNDVVRHVILRIVVDQAGLAQELAAARAKLKELQKSEHDANTARAKDFDRVTERIDKQTEAVNRNARANEVHAQAASKGAQGVAEDWEKARKATEAATKSTQDQARIERENSRSSSLTAAKIARDKEKLDTQLADQRHRNADSAFMREHTQNERLLHDLQRIADARRQSQLGTQLAGYNTDIGAHRAATASYLEDAAASRADAANSRTGDVQDAAAANAAKRRASAVRDTTRFRQEMNNLASRGNVLEQQAAAIAERRAMAEERYLRTRRRGLAGGAQAAGAAFGDALTGGIRAVATAPTSFRRGLGEFDDGPKLRTLSGGVAEVGKEAGKAERLVGGFLKLFRKEGDDAVRGVQRISAAFKAAVADIGRARLGGSGGNLFGDFARNAMTALSSIGSSFNGLGKHFFSFRTLIVAAIGALGPLASMLGAVGAAALGLMSNIGALSGALLALPGIVGAAVAGFGALALVMKPLTTVFSDYTAKQKESISVTKQAKDAALELKDAQLSQQAAEVAYQRAVADAPRNQMRLNDAIKQAARDIQDYRMARQKLKFDEEGAALDAESAQQAYRRSLADPTATNLDRRKAAHDYQGALYDKADQKLAGQRLIEDSNEAFKKGVNGADAVVDAQRAVQDSTLNIAQAYVAWQKSIVAVNKAAATKAAGGTAAAQLEADLKALPPKTQAVARAMVALGGEYKKMRERLSENIFGPLSGDTGKFADVLQELESFLSPASIAIGTFAKKALDLFTNQDWKDFFSSQGVESAHIIRVLGDALLSGADAFRSITEVARPFTRFIVDGIGKMAESFKNFATSDDGRDKIIGFLELTEKRIKELWPVIKNLAGGFAGFFAALNTAGGGKDDFTTWFNNGLLNASKTFKKLGDQARDPNGGFQKWLRDVRPLLHDIVKFLSSAGHFLGDLFSNPANLKEASAILEAISTKWLPKLSEIFDNLSRSGLVSKIASGIGDAFGAISEFFKHGGGDGIAVFASRVEDTAAAVSNVVSFLSKIPGVLQTIGVVAAFVFGAAFFARFTGLIGAAKLLIGAFRGVRNIKNSIANSDNDDPATGSRTKKPGTIGPVGPAANKSGKTKTGRPVKQSKASKVRGTIGNAFGSARNATKNAFGGAKNAAKDAITGDTQMLPVLQRSERYLRQIEINTRRYGSGSSGSSSDGPNGPYGGGPDDNRKPSRRGGAVETGGEELGGTRNARPSRSSRGTRGRRAGLGGLLGGEFADAIRSEVDPLAPARPHLPGVSQAEQAEQDLAARHGATLAGTATNRPANPRETPAARNARRSSANLPALQEPWTPGTSRRPASSTSALNDSHTVRPTSPVRRGMPARDPFDFSIGDTTTVSGQQWADQRADYTNRVAQAQAARDQRNSPAGRQSRLDAVAEARQRRLSRPGSSVEVYPGEDWRYSQQPEAPQRRGLPGRRALPGPDEQYALPGRPVLPEAPSRPELPGRPALPAADDDRSITPRRRWSLGAPETQLALPPGQRRDRYGQFSRPDDRPNQAPTRGARGRFTRPGPPERPLLPDVGRDLGTYAGLDDDYYVQPPQQRGPNGRFLPREKAPKTSRRITDRLRNLGKTLFPPGDEGSFGGFGLFGRDDEPGSTRTRPRRGEVLEGDVLTEDEYHQTRRNRSLGIDENDERATRRGLPEGRAGGGRARGLSRLLGGAERTAGRGLLRGVGGGLLRGAAGGIGGLVAGAAASLGGDYLINKYVKNDADASSLQRGMGAVANGAGIGASIGSIVPGVGTVIGGAVGGLVGGAYSLYKDKNLRSFVGDKVGGAVKGVGSAIGGAASSVWGGVKGLFGGGDKDDKGAKGSGIGDALKGALGGAVLGPLGMLIGGTGLGGKILDSLHKAGGGIATFFTKTIPHAFESTVKGITNFFTHTLPTLPNRAFKAIAFGLGRAFVFLTEQAPHIVANFFTKTIPHAASSAWKGVVHNLWDPFVSFIKAIPGFFTETIPHWFSSAWHWAQQKIAVPMRRFVTETIPQFFTETIPRWFKAAPAWFKTHVVDNVTTFFTDTVPKFFTQTLPAAIKALPGFLYGNLVQPILDFFKGLAGHVGDFLKGGWGWAKSVFKGVGGAFGAGEDVQRGKMSGGLIEGIYQGIEDKAMTPTSPGEFVVRRSKVQQPFGKQFLADYNEGRIDPAQFYGGLSASAAPQVMSIVPPDATALTGAVPTVVNHTINHAPVMGDVTIHNPVRERSERTLRRQVEIAAIRHRR